MRLRIGYMYRGRTKRCYSTQPTAASHCLESVRLVIVWFPDPSSPPPSAFFIFIFRERKGLGTRLVVD